MTNSSPPYLAQKSLGRFNVSLLAQPYAKKILKHIRRALNRKMHKISLRAMLYLKLSGISVGLPIGDRLCCQDERIRCQVASFVESSLPDFRDIVN
jgi:hypothetical protein